MIYKQSVSPTAICIGSFTNPVSGQFQYDGKKGKVYLFTVQSISDEGVTVSNVLTKETALVPFTEVLKIKELEGGIVSAETYISADPMAIITAVMSGGDFPCVNKSFEAGTVISVAIANKQATLTFSSGAMQVGCTAEDLLVPAGSITFGK